MANFPTSLDNGTTLPTPTGTNTQNSPDHAALHGTENAAIIAVETKIGTGSSTPASGTLLIGTGAGTSSWSQLTSAQLLAILSDETGTGSAVFATSPTLVTPKIDTINENTPSNGTTIGGVNIKSGALNTNNSVVTANITDASVTAPKMNNSGTWNSSWAWVTWSPTLTNLSGGTQTYAKYVQIGKTVHFRFKYTLAGAGVSGDVAFSPPVTLNSDYVSNANLNATALFFDAGSTQYGGVVSIISTTSLNPRCVHTDGARATNQALSSTNPFVFGTGDIIEAHGTYEVV